MSKLFNFMLVSIAISTFVFKCTEVNYSHPLDAKGDNYIVNQLGPTALEDDDGDGTLNYKDPDHDLTKDTIPPVITILEGDTVRIPIQDPNGLVNYYAEKVKATDIIDGVVTDITNRVKPDKAVSIFIVGYYKITYTVTDDAGLTTTAVRVVEIYPVEQKDTVPPTLTINGDTMHVNKGDLFTDPGAAAYDLVDGNLSTSIKKTGEVNMDIAGTYFLTYTVSDKSDNSTTKIRTVIVQDITGPDVTAPVITLNPPDTVYLTVGEAYVEYGCQALDNQDGDITSKVQIDNKVGTAAATYYVTYTVIDEAGNTASARRVVKVTGIGSDITPPILTLSGSSTMSVTLNSDWVDPGYSAYDETDGDITARVVLSQPPNTSVSGTYTITYTVDDEAGNRASKSRTVNVGEGGSDITPPVLTLKGSSSMTVAKGSIWNDPGYSAIDDTDGDISANVVVSDPPNTSVDGSYTVTYTVADKAGNQATKTRTVLVDPGIAPDIIPPVLELDGNNPDSIGLGTAYVDPGYIATDDRDGNITADVIVASNVDVNTEGTYQITYTVTDGGGNTVTQTRTVVVKEGVVVTDNLLDKYGVPSPSALPTKNASYTSSVVDGEGAPALNTITTFTFNWDLTQKQIYQFSFNYTGAPYYLNLEPTNTLGEANPSITLTGSGVTGLDGEYYLKIDGTNLIWVKTDGSFAIIWSE